MKRGFASRPEARFALWAGVGGAIAATLVSVKQILASTSSTAVIGFIFVPFAAAIVAVPAGIWGLALGCVWLSRRGDRVYPAALLAAAWVVALAAPAALGWSAWRGLALEAAVREASGMGAASLEEASARSAWKDDRFFLGALAQNPRASSDLLDRIARRRDPELWESMGSFWDVMGENRKGLAVMRLVARHRNTGPETLERLAARTQAKYVLNTVLANPKTPANVLERHFGSSDYLIEWGLSSNPNTPPNELERLARSADRYTRINVAGNASAPREILEQLARDADSLVAQRALQALEGRPRGAREIPARTLS